MNAAISIPSAPPSGLRVPTGITGVAARVPGRVVTNRELVEGLDTTDEWIVSKTGIRTRRFLDEGEHASDLCLAAARTALERAAVRPADVDVIIVATFTPDQPLPSMGLVIKEGLGADRAWTLDLNQAACAGGVYGLLLASHLLQNDGIGTVLVIGAEALSRVTDPLDRRPRVFFGDAAGAAVVRRTPSGTGLLSWDVGSKLSYGVQIPAGGSGRPATADTVRGREHYLRMDGRTVWNEATAQLPLSIGKAVKDAGLTIDEIDHFVLHQANLNIIHQVLDVLDVPRHKALTPVTELGNTGAATVFTVFEELYRSGLPAPGDTVAVSAIGAGFLWGTLCVRQA